jgi:hypothetical protein
VSGPDDRERQPTSEQFQVEPPGHFLSAELQSDCARFLEDVRNLVRQREREAVRVAVGQRL